MTPEQKAVTSKEEADGWISNFRQYCEGQQMELSYDNKEFIALERAYWLGVIAGRGSELVPIDIHRVLYAFKSPVLEFKASGRKRVRRTKAQLEADKAAAVGHEVAA